MYDTIKTCRWNFFNFSGVVHYRKICKNQVKNRGSPCYFLSSRGQKIKTITKIEQKILFLFTFSVSFFVACLAQKLIYTIYIWFNFVWLIFWTRSSVKLNYFRSLCERMVEMFTHFTTKADVARNLINDLFSKFDWQRTFPQEGF